MKSSETDKRRPVAVFRATSIHHLSIEFERWMLAPAIIHLVIFETYEGLTYKGSFKDMIVTAVDIAPAVDQVLRLDFSSDLLCVNEHHSCSGMCGED